MPQISDCCCLCGIKQRLVLKGQEPTTSVQTGRKLINKDFIISLVCMHVLINALRALCASQMTVSELLSLHSNAGINPEWNLSRQPLSAGSWPLFTNRVLIFKAVGFISITLVITWKLNVLTAVRGSVRSGRKYLKGNLIIRSLKCQTVHQTRSVIHENFTSSCSYETSTIFQTVTCSWEHRDDASPFSLLQININFYLNCLILSYLIM